MISDPKRIVKKSIATGQSLTLTKLSKTLFLPVSGKV